MALKFGPQWLRDLSDGGAGTSQPHSPTVGTKFKLADYRYGREEMLSLWNINSPPPDQVRKHLPIFSKDIQKPITMMPLTEDEQRLISQGFNSTGVLRAAGRGSAPTLRVSRGGGTVDRGRGRGRGRGEGYVPRSENGDIGYHRSSQDGWEQVGRKLERSYSRGYEEGSSGNTKREYSRSASDNNWRDKRQEEDDEEEGSWRNARDPNPRWGSQPRRDWREPRDLGGFEGERRLPPLRRGFDSDIRGPRRTSESHDNDGEVPEWVEDDVGDDPGTFDSSGAFVSTKDGRRYPDSRNEMGSAEDSDRRKKGSGSSSQTYHSGQEVPDTSHSTSAGDKGQGGRKYIPPNARNGGSHSGMGDDSGGGQGENGDVRTMDKKISRNEPSALAADSRTHSNKGDGDSGFAFPHREEEDRARAPPGQYSHAPPAKSSPHHQEVTSSQKQVATVSHNSPSPLSLPTSTTDAAASALASALDAELQLPPLHHQNQQEGVSGTLRTPIDPAFAHVEKSLQNLVAQMTLDAEKDGHSRDVSREALPLTHENANKWFYKDPQGEIQGPFTNDEMAQWFSAGYFTMSLVVKRGCDDSFKQLGELIKRYGRVPFLPGTPLPPLISTSLAVSEESLQTPSLVSSSPAVIPVNPVNPLNTVTSSLPQSAPSMMNPSVLPSLVNPAQDSLLQQMMLLQQEYLKQTFLMRQMQMQTLQQLQHEQDNFQSLPLEQQQQLSMQVMMQANPLLLQQLQHIQQQQLILQQQLQRQQQQQQQQQGTHSSSALPGDDRTPKNFPPPQPASTAGLSHTALTAATASPSSSSVAASTNHTSMAAPDEGLSVWGNISQQQSQPQTQSVWSRVAAGGQPQPQQQPESLWDVDTTSEGLSSAYKAQLEQMKRQQREEERMREEERLREEEMRRQEELERKKEELLRQQEELEQQREMVRREKEELERQKQMDLQKRAEAKRLEEEARRQEDERIQREIEKQRREQQESERRRQEEERKRLEEEKKREKELKKQEEKKRKEEEKKRLLEEQKRQEEQRRRQQEEEEERLRQLQLEQELRLQAELQQQQEREEEQRLQREAEERERAEAQRRQQMEIQKQHESLRRLQQAQREQLANMQLPAHSNWANQQSHQSGPTQSRSLTEIQEEEARKEQERLQRQQQELQRMQEQAIFLNQQHQQKSWATHASQGVTNRGPSLLDIQQQEQENMKKNQKDKPKPVTYQSKLSLSGGSTWAAGPPSSGWPSGSSTAVHHQQLWETSPAVGGGGIWDQPPVIQAQRRQQGAKESGEFPALRNPTQQNKKAAAAKANSKPGKAGSSKSKKEEETVQKLFQSRQQDDFTQWVTDRVSRFSAQIDVPTFVSFIVEVDSPEDVRDYMVSYLGDTKESKDFAKQFVEKRNRSRNQARLEKQQEEDSIWGPAPAVNPHIQTRATNNSSAGGGDGGESGSGSAASKGKNRKKKQRMQKVDGSILGFTVHSDPNRKNAAGELESI